jgi:hypothetical protein
VVKSDGTYNRQAIKKVPILSDAYLERFTAELIQDTLGNTREAHVKKSWDPVVSAQEIKSPDYFNVRFVRDFISVPFMRTFAIKIHVTRKIGDCGWISLKESHLSFKIPGMPNVIRIKKGYQVSLSSST